MYEMTGPHVLVVPPNRSRDPSACATTDRTRFADLPKKARCADPTGWSGRAPDPRTGRRTQPPAVLHCRPEDRPAHSAGLTAPLLRSEEQPACAIRSPRHLRSEDHRPVRPRSNHLAVPKNDRPDSTYHPLGAPTGARRFPVGSGCRSLLRLRFSALRCGISTDRRAAPQVAKTRSFRRPQITGSYPKAFHVVHRLVHNFLARMWRTGAGQSVAASLVPWSIARFASSSAATSAPPMTCTETPAS